MSLGDEFKDEIMFGEFYQVDVPGEGKFNYPAADYTPAELMAMFEIDEVTEVTGYFVELLDDETQELVWHGPFDSVEEIEDHLDNLYG